METPLTHPPLLERIQQRDQPRFGESARATLSRHIFVKGHHLMRKIIEYTLVSVDGVFAGADISGFFDYRDDAYLRMGWGNLLPAEAFLWARTPTEGLARICPGGPHPWPTGTM